MQGNVAASWQADLFNTIDPISDIGGAKEFDSKRDATHYSTLNFRELETDDEPERFKERLWKIAAPKQVKGKPE